MVTQVFGITFVCRLIVISSEHLKSQIPNPNSQLSVELTARSEGTIELEENIW